ncbi:MAG: metallophosphoesterase [Actinomycetota bacterium]
MDLFAFSDAHLDRGLLEKIVAEPADLHVCLGDLTIFGRGLETMAEVLAPLGDRLYLLPGNHETAEAVEQVCSQFGFRPLHAHSYAMRGGWFLAGVGLSPPTPFNTPGDVADEDLAVVLEAYRGLSPLVLAAHVPPAETPLGTTVGGEAAGSKAIRRFIDEEQPALMLCGHVHESAEGETRIGRTRVVNPGRLGAHFQV